MPTHVIYREIRSHTTPVTDTDDTDEESSVGGSGFYTHSTMCLTHQHWVAQLISAGGFNVHCTQAAEATHRTNMHLAASRVRFLDCNQTQASMLRWMGNLQIFEGIKQRGMEVQTPRRSSPDSDRLGNLLRLSFGGDRFGNAQAMSTFLHSEVRVAEIELTNLIITKLNLTVGHPDTLPKLSRLKFDFGQKFMRRDGRVFWGTDTAYTSSSTQRRRDILSLRGLHGGNALCCETVCFVTISNLRSLRLPDQGVDSVSYALVRWLEVHPDAHERDPQRRPVCPGPLHVNNCLWTYARTPTSRRVLTGPRGVFSRAFENQRGLFGKTLREQNSCRGRESRAYYDLVTTDSIVDTANMCQLFLPNSCETDGQNWLQTVTLF